MSPNEKKTQLMKLYEAQVKQWVREKFMARNAYIRKEEGVKSVIRFLEKKKNKKNNKRT